MLESASSFLEYRRNQEARLRSQAKLSSFLPGLVTIEVNLTELCNRKCVFCPRVDPEIYPNRSLHAPKQVIKQIIKGIKECDYRAKVSFSGFGEPLLYPDFAETIAQFRKASGDLLLETNTNGDKLDVERLDELWDSGLNCLYWNLYDGHHQVEEVTEIIGKSRFPGDRIRLRPHWEGCDLEKEAGLILNNRSGMLNPGRAISAVEGGCNYPFYKMLIDWNGNVLCCSNDWGRKFIVGNILSRRLQDLWMDQNWHAFRLNLLEGDRSRNSPCNTCNVNGSLFGGGSVDDYFQAYSRNGGKSLIATDAI